MVFIQPVVNNVPGSLRGEYSRATGVGPGTISSFPILANCSDSGIVNAWFQLSLIDYMTTLKESVRAWFSKE